MYRLLIPLFCFLIVGCNDVKHPDASNARQELKVRKIMRINPTVVLNEAETLSESIFKSDSLKNVYKVRCNPMNSDNFKNIEKEIAEAYLYNIEQNLPVYKNLQNTPNGDFLISHVENDSTLCFLTLTKKELTQRIQLRKR